MTPAQIDALRDAVGTFDPESDDPHRLLIGTGLVAYDLAMEVLAHAEADTQRVAA